MTMFTQRETRILDQARDIISRHYQRGVQLCSPNDVRRCVMVELAPLEHEEFGIILLDNQNQLLHREILFRGTLNSVSVHPREVIKRVLKHNAAAVILVHNHPSGEPEPSRCDIQLTKKLQELLEMLDVRLLDHFIVARTETVSMAERGLV
ncbi:TPA: DNA repair protein RadC [Escherichia coli]|uniref:RadC family protein n=1 Tax=Escherichia coli TaxID=562 RepID=UPI00092DD40B|nr:DNA repair protein RadC [Escherichia coli]EGF2693172.1 DNA repair protein RadC [Shigella sonnei]APK62940.1 DNA repair protein [Escherichia coli]APK67197.1 DNA repair protein [Escherichia coli]EEW1996053.1 DNA repair protein RadC [Escherichia coli]EFH4790856.1 DNA repair protein RadC [Escherichia coli]